MTFGSLFTISNFASLSELAPLLAELPQCATQDEFDVARRDDRGPSRFTASHLINKMTEFTNRAEIVYLSSMETLDTARRRLSDRHEVRYLSLFEIAEMLLPESLAEDGKFPPSALYAVHTALHRDEIAFRPLSPTSDCHRRDHLFEIYPSSFLMAINRITTMVRSYYISISPLTNTGTRKLEPLADFGSFIDKARQAVQASRKNRAWTTHGISAPSKSPIVVQSVDWSDSDQDILRFLQWWASYDLFEPSSRFSAYGATILRSLDLYNDASLDQSLAWTFLQEVGVIDPWESPSRYKVRFPRTKVVSGGGLARNDKPDIKGSRREDVASGHRVVRSDSTVYCIDGPETVMIDDGVSLERTNKTDEFWIHVHTADPASGINPTSSLRDYMELIPENIYLQGHFQAMLSDQAGGGPAHETQDLVKEYSLRNGCPALTFSAKVNYAGDLLDYQIQPSQLGKVAYLDPADVASFCQESTPHEKPVYEIAVGTPPSKKSSVPNRHIVRSGALEQPEKDDLLTLYALGEAQKKRRLDKGAWPYFFPRPSVEVQFEALPEEATDEKHFRVQPPDPYIKISTEPHAQSSLVSNTMVLAGEVAARWCADRGIPAPFRQDKKSRENFDVAYKYATEDIYPQIHRGVEPSQAHRNMLATMTGSIELLPTPGPYFLMGLDMYVKTTSPLRRFSDMLAHWQIHAALAHERQIGRSITTNDDLAGILPFSELELKDTLALLQMREKMAKRVSRGNHDWILMALVRAWQFEKTAPASFRFTVESRWLPGLVGRLDWFGVNAILDAPNMQDLVLLKNTRIGDEFDVELVKVNVHSGHVVVRAIRYHGQPLDDKETHSSSPAVEGLVV